MWVPTTEDEIELALANRALAETATFEAKSALPAPGKNEDLAKSICAMTVDGGVILYGVGGPDKNLPTEPFPFPLADVPERIAQVAQTAISEPPHIEIHRIETPADPTSGFICVVVPPSPRAPHMLLLGQNRYYGRGPAGNRILTEGEVARLYERRERWATDRVALVAQIVADSPFGGAVIAQGGALAVFARPVAPGRELLRDAARELAVDEFLRTELVIAAQHADITVAYGAGIGQAQWVTSDAAEVWVMSDGGPAKSIYQLRVIAGVDGTLTLWHCPIGRSGFIAEGQLARDVYQLLAVAGWCYERAGFFGAVDIGVIALGLKDTRGAGWAAPQYFSDSGVPYGRDAYDRSERILASELRGATKSLTARLLAPLFEALSPSSLDPFKETRVE